MVGINIKQELKDKLYGLKSHDRDSYGMVIGKLVDFYLARSDVDDLPKKFVGKTDSIHNDVSVKTRADPKGDVEFDPKESVVEPEMDVAEELEDAKLQAKDDESKRDAIDALKEEESDVVGEVVDATLPEEDSIADDKQ